MSVLFATAFVAIPSIGMVQAATVNFSINDDASVNIFGRTHLGGTVTGTLYGLADNGFSMPTSVVFTSDVSAFGMSADLFTPHIQIGAGFELNNGTVVGADVLLDFVLTNGESWLTFNSSEVQNQNFLMRSIGVPRVAIGNQEGFGGATYTTISAVPEPSTWAMLLLGVASIGFVTYRRNRTTRSDACRVFGWGNQDV